jgi:hypothetical protein
MKTSLSGYRSKFRDRVLDLLWSQWTALGVSGRGPEWHGPPIDPEALLLASCTIARHDARLFDAMVEWIGLHGRYVNVQRLKRILTNEPFGGKRVFGAVAAMAKNSVSAAKWARSAAVGGNVGKPVPLFYLKDGRPMPTVAESDPVFAKHGLLRDLFTPRGVVESFRPELTANLILRLRALFGVNARCEIVTYLLLNSRGSPRSLARDTYYFPATISKALGEMRNSGFVVARTEGRRRDHRLTPQAWRELLLGDVSPAWIVWPRILCGLECIWKLLWDETLHAKSLLAQASTLRRVLLKSAVDRIDTSGLDFAFGNISNHPGEKLIPFFIGEMTALLDLLARTGQIRAKKKWRGR